MLGNCSGDYDREDAPRMDPNSRVPVMSKTVSKATEARVRALTEPLEADEVVRSCNPDPYGCDGPGARDVYSDERDEMLNSGTRDDPENSAAATARDPPMRGSRAPVLKPVEESML